MKRRLVVGLLLIMGIVGISAKTADNPDVKRYLELEKNSNVQEYLKRRKRLRSMEGKNAGIREYVAMSPDAQKIIRNHRTLISSSAVKVLLSARRMYFRHPSNWYKQGWVRSMKNPTARQFLNLPTKVRIFFERYGTAKLNEFLSVRDAIDFMKKENKEVKEYLALQKKPVVMAYRKEHGLEMPTLPPAADVSEADQKDIEQYEALLKDSDVEAYQTATHKKLMLLIPGQTVSWLAVPVKYKDQYVAYTTRNPIIKHYLALESEKDVKEYLALEEYLSSKDDDQFHKYQSLRSDSDVRAYRKLSKDPNVKEYMKLVKQKSLKAPLMLKDESVRSYLKYTASPMVIRYNKLLSSGPKLKEYDRLMDTDVVKQYISFNEKHASILAKFNKIRTELEYDYKLMEKRGDRADFEEIERLRVLLRKLVKKASVKEYLRLRDKLAVRDHIQNSIYDSLR